MERDLWTQIVVALKALPPRRPRNSLYSSNDVLAVILCPRRHPLGFAPRSANLMGVQTSQLAGPGMVSSSS